ncbi:hypothetical protein F4677DRAFT_440802 [Hypoxylon crocopeplum]|nr:hypothetical protein F4677DRAFT_440802 [Hypoxylon crocopeplum]
MRPSAILRRFAAALGTAQVFSKETSEKDEFDLRVKRTENETLLQPNPKLDFDLDSTNYTVWDNTDNLDTQYLIPVSHSACTHMELDPEEIRASIHVLIDWSASDPGRHKVKPKSQAVATIGGAGAYLCNCKFWWYDAAPADEMWEFYVRLARMCGDGQSGWLFSEKWDKGYAVASSQYIDDMKPPENLCPPYCCGRD